MIFEDPSKKRWKITLSLFISIVCIAAIMLTFTIYSFVVNSPIPTLSKVIQEKGVAIKNSLIKEESKDMRKRQGKIGKHNNILNNSETRQLKKIANEVSLPKYAKNSFVHTAFLVQSSQKSVDDVKKHINKLDVVFPDWFTFTGKQSVIDETIDSSLSEYFNAHKTLVFPRISNSDEGGTWFGQDFSHYIHNEENRHNLCILISNTLNKYNLKGINLDFEAIDSSASNDYLELLIELRELLYKNKQYLTIDVPMNDDAFDYEAIGKIVDSVIIMGYDEHYAGGHPGPIASQNWFENGVEDVLKRVPNKKAIIAMGEYAYDWNITKNTPATSLSFDDAMVLAGEVGADVQTEKASKNSNFSYKDNNSDTHQVWILDAVSLWNQMQILDKQNVYGVSLWCLGLEDPTVWGYYSLDNLRNFDPKLLENVRTLNSVNFEGEGEILKVSTFPKSGNRKLTFDNKIIDYADYSTLPTDFVVQKFGKLKSINIALTFDDGPDQAYTDQILDVLKHENVKAAFFVVGDQVQRFPNVLKREVTEGHLVGNHTYTHPNLAKISRSSIQPELNTVQRLIEAISGKQTLLFRTPYNTNSTPEKPDELKPLYEAAQMGYITVGADVDSMDYDKPGVNKIVSNVVNQLKDTGSNIIVMHDSGGNREQTVAVLKILIPKLRGMGYKFVSLNDLLGVPQLSLMPNISLKEQVIVWADKAWTVVYTHGWALIVILFFLSTVISILRILFLGCFVLKSQKVQKIQSSSGNHFEPFVTVIVPAYNEETVIGKTLTWLSKSNYKNLEVLVVDDGSTDHTADVVNDFMKENDKIRLISKSNGGKFSALNLAFQEAKAEYVVTIDADTMILPDTIGNLVVPFKDKTVDAVCGNVQVGNVKNIITGFQAVEYITTQNYDRRAFDELNCISVVPGATGAWKKEKVIESGGYSSLTLTEDADLTLTMLEKGAKIIYAPSAKSVTEAPETISGLFKQRFRWSYGTFQCLWKHRKSFFKGNLGRIALPNMFIFQIIFPVLSPIGDLVFLLSILRGDMKAILSGYLLFLAMDMAASIMAFAIEKAPKKYILFVLIQRFFYRQFMYVVTYKSIVAAIKGRKHGWNKLRRTNSVNIID